MGKPTSCDGCGVCCLVHGHQPVLYYVLKSQPAFADVWVDRADVDRMDQVPNEARGDVMRANIASRRCCWLGDDMRCKWHEWRPECCRRFEVGCDECLEIRERMGIQ